MTTVTAPMISQEDEQGINMDNEILSESQTPANNNPIRHRGRALVRGKFRRVWRPRWLEVRANGFLSYYECPDLTPSSALDVFVDPATMISETVEEADDQYHSKVPKCTLWIHHARVIDPTTLRDMHVGLPRGSYGFLFHGHRMDEDDGDLLQDGLQLLSMGQACQPTTDATPRDFLCAVNTLEEAQSWVIALQWAASMGRDASFQASTLPYTLPFNSRAPNDVSSWQDDGLSVTSSFSSAQPQLSSQGKSEVLQNQSEATASTKKKGKQSSPSKPASNRNAGKMVVTKVVGYTLVRLESWKWEIAYQIQVLLVMPTKEQNQLQECEEWSILRTAENFQLIMDKLKVALPAATCQKLHRQTERINSLPRLQSRRHLADWSNSVSVVNSILRAFCLEATVVDSSVLKRFLGVHAAAANNAVPQKSPFWDFHDSAGLRTRPKRTILHKSIDQYVKQWLQQPKENPSVPDMKLRFLCWYLRLPQPATTYASAALLSLWLSSSTLPTINRFIRKFQIIPHVTMRLDALVASWLVAAGVGHFLPETSPNTASVPKMRTPIKQLPHSPAPTTPETSPIKASCKDLARATATPNKSLMDEDDSQDMLREVDGEVDEDGINELTERPNDEGGQTVEAETSFLHKHDASLSSPLPHYSSANNITESCWSTPEDNIFHVRGPNYLTDRVKIPSGDASFSCKGVDMWMTDNPERHIARHPSVMGGQLANPDQDMFLVNFLLPFGNFVSYFSVPPLEQFANPQLAGVWTRFIQGDQQYRYVASTGSLPLKCFVSHGT